MVKQLQEFAKRLGVIPTCELAIVSLAGSAASFVKPENMWGVVIVALAAIVAIPAAAIVTTIMLQGGN